MTIQILKEKVDLVQQELNKTEVIMVLAKRNIIRIKSHIITQKSAKQGKEEVVDQAINIVKKSRWH
jgi:hypothetical protein